MAHREVRELVRQGGTFLARQLRVAFGLFDQRVLDMIRTALLKSLALRLPSGLPFGIGQGHGPMLDRYITAVESGLNGRSSRDNGS